MWNLRFDETALSTMWEQAQRWWGAKESVGQLFVNDLSASTIVISSATSLKAQRSSWASVTFDPEEAMRQRVDLLQRGLHCIGLWHTHPESAPTPSGVDERLAADHARAALPVLNGLAFVIVSNRPSPISWYVGFHDGARFHRAAFL